MDAEEHILSELKDGAKLSDVYNSTVAMVKKEKPDLVTTILYHVEQLYPNIRHFCLVFEYVS